MCIAFGAIAGWFVRYCMETTAYVQPKCGKGSKPGRNAAQSKKGPATKTDSDPDLRDRSDGELDPRSGSRRDDDINSNMGFDVVSEPPDTSVPPPPVPETVVHTPPTRIAALTHATRQRRGGYIDRDTNLTMWHTESEGTMIHIRHDCRGLAPRRKALVARTACSWCCGGVVIIP